MLDSEMISTIHTNQTNDWNRKNMHDKMEANPDWAVKRLSAIIREAERLEVDITRIEPSTMVIEALWKGLPLKGKISYESRGGYYHESRWMRPRIALRLWVQLKGSVSLLHYNGKEMYRRTKMGGETLEIVFGKERMMVYNRCMIATLNCMGKI